MSKIKADRRWRYLVGIIVGLSVFIALIPSCGFAFSSRYDAGIQKSVETKSFDEIVANLPTAEKIRSMNLAPHPRLLVDEDRFVEIKQQVYRDETTKEWYEKLYKDAEAILDETPSRYKFQDAIRMLDTSRTVLERISILSLVYRVDRDERFLERAWQELKAASEFPNWNPDHFLDTAEMTCAFAIGYDWLYEYWTEQQRKIISSAIVEKGLIPASNEYAQNVWWTETTNNWNQVCNGGIGIGALAVLDLNPKLASEVLYNGLQRIPQAMKKYAPDGGWSEGAGYWHYATKYNTLLLASLETSLHNDFDLSKVEGFSETGTFPVYMTGTFGLSFNFSDAKEGRFRSPQLFWMANKFERPIYSVYQQKVARPEAMDLIWYKPLKTKNPSKPLPLDRYFRSSEIVSMRSSWHDPEGIFVGFKAGDNKSGHSNLDLGTFVLDASGVRWAVDLGSDDYNLPGYFDRKKERWRYYRNRAEGQNTLAIDPDAQPDQNPEASAKIIDFDSKSNRAIAVADLTSAYDSDVNKLVRKITLDRKKQKVLIQDIIVAEDRTNAWWFMHTRANIDVVRSGRMAILSQDDARLRAKIINCDRCHFEVLDAKPLETSPNPSGQESNSGLKKLAIELEDINTEKLQVSFSY